ncbi:hypothetical protein PIIN_01118 [Serendipita indica DSM 11827]|uniref:holo-[acyl-carrier-protein] synthase n=1 Tax=Serendipita indica (strain DSM 11827) TaxID=1109443 RepID=G4T7F2_SERID|nr:hypothetical protein PIIN_01118 [Serendipita indica DSM 11827]
MTHPKLYLAPLQFATLDTDQLEHVFSFMDQTAVDRARRFYHQDDAWRFLIGRMLRIVMLGDIGRDRGLTVPNLEFSQTPAGKPYIVAPQSLSSVGFNVSHDGAVVLMGILETRGSSGASAIGVDIMKAEIPVNDDLLSFIASIESTLTRSESRHLRQLAAAESTRSQATKHLFQLWTLKEAYVKATRSRHHL